MAKTIIPALLVSLALHAALAVALAVYLDHTPVPDELAQLDLTSVDLSFAETVDESAAAVASAPSALREASPPPKPLKCECPEPKADVDLRSQELPRLREARLPAPTEPVEKLPERAKPAEPPSPPSAPMAASAPRQAHVDAPPKPRCAIRPDYPRESRLRGEYGDVALELDVAADGSVSDVRVLVSPGFPLLDEAAVRAARAARFKPAKLGGRSVASTVRLTLSFKLK